MSNDVGTVGISNYAQVNVSFTYTVLVISPPLPRCSMKLNRSYSSTICTFLFQNLLGDIVYVELPEIGNTIEQHGKHNSWNIFTYSMDGCPLAIV